MRVGMGGRGARWNCRRRSTISASFFSGNGRVRGMIWCGVQGIIVQEHSLLRISTTCFADDDERGSQQFSQIKEMNEDVGEKDFHSVVQEKRRHPT